MRQERNEASASITWRNQRASAKTRNRYSSEVACRNIFARKKMVSAKTTNSCWYLGGVMFVLISTCCCYDAYRVLLRSWAIFLLWLVARTTILPLLQSAALRWSLRMLRLPVRVCNPLFWLTLRVLHISCGSWKLHLARTMCSPINLSCNQTDVTAFGSCQMTRRHPGDRDRGKSRKHRTLSPHILRGRTASESKNAHIRAIHPGSSS